MYNSVCIMILQPIFIKSTMKMYLLYMYIIRIHAHAHMHAHIVYIKSNFFLSISLHQAVVSFLLMYLYMKVNIQKLYIHTYIYIVLSKCVFDLVYIAIFLKNYRLD